MALEFFKSLNRFELLLKLICEDMSQPQQTRDYKEYRSPKAESEAERKTPSINIQYLLKVKRDNH